MRTISAEELDSIMELQDDWLLLDVLPPESYERRHIPGAYSAPVTRDDFEQRAELLTGSRDEPVIVYCEDKGCRLSPQAARRLERKGFTNVFDFEGGLDEWTRAGFRLTSDVESEAESEAQ